MPGSARNRFPTAPSAGGAGSSPGNAPGRRTEPQRGRACQEVDRFERLLGVDAQLVERQLDGSGVGAL